MRKFAFSILVFFFNILPIYALSFEMTSNVNKLEVNVSEKANIDISLNNIKDSDKGIASCELKIDFDKGIQLDNKITTYGNWQSISGTRGYSFDTIDAVLTNTKIFTIPVIVNNTGKVKISSIVCTDVDDKQAASSDIEVLFTVKSEEPSSSSSSSGSSSSKPSSSSSSKPSSSSSSDKSSSSSQDNSSSSSMSSSDSSGEDVPGEPLVYLADLKVTGGVINFRYNVFEYGILVDDLDNFSIEPIKKNETDMFDISESFANDKKTFVVTVWNKDDDMQKYTLYVVENSPSSSTPQVVDNKKDYSGVFIIIIVVLVIINIARIGYNMYKNKKLK